MGLKLQTAPANEPLDLEADVKPHLRIDFADDDGYISLLVSAVRKHVEDGELASALITQTWDLTLDNFPTMPFELPRPPLQSVTSITYTDVDGNSDTVASSVYLAETTSWPGRIVFKQSQSWPSVVLKEAGGVVIRFVAGYGDDIDDVPEPIRLALLLAIGDFYENRENSPLIPGITQPIVLPFAARQLLASYRRRSFG